MKVTKRNNFFFTVNLALSIAQSYILFMIINYRNISFETTIYKNKLVLVITRKLYLKIVYFINYLQSRFEITAPFIKLKFF